MTIINNIGEIGIASQIKKVGTEYHNAVLFNLFKKLNKYSFQLEKYLKYEKYSGCYVKNGDIIIDDMDRKKEMKEKAIDNFYDTVKDSILIYIQSFNQSEKRNVKILTDILMILQKIKYRKNDDDLKQYYSNLNNLINKLSF